MSEPSDEDRWKALAIREMLIGDNHSKGNAAYFLDLGRQGISKSSLRKWEAWVSKREATARDN